MAQVALVVDSCDDLADTTEVAPVGARASISRLTAPGAFASMDLDPALLYEAVVDHLTAQGIGPDEAGAGAQPEGLG